MTRQTSKLTATAVALVRARRLLTSGRGRDLRLQAGLTQAELADAAMVSPAALSRWEAGSRSPRGAAALRYLDAIDAALTELDQAGDDRHGDCDV